jgi:hypothetical protein
MSETRTQIIEATTRMAVFTDGRRWDDLPGIFTPTVRLDYSALFGWDAAEMSAAEVASSWAEALSPLTTQHLVTNHLVDITDDEATVTASFQATHVAVATGDRWVVGGDYRCGRPSTRASRSTLTASVTGCVGGTTTSGPRPSHSLTAAFGDDRAREDQLRLAPPSRRGRRSSSRDSTGLVSQSHRPRPELLAPHEVQLEPLAQAGEQRRPMAGQDGLHDKLVLIDQSQVR